MYETVTYNEYLGALNEIAILDETGQLNEGVLDSLKGLTGKVGAFISNAKKTMADVVDTTKLETKDLIKAFKNKEIFSVLKKVGFSVKKLLAMLKAGQKALNGGLGKIFEEIHDSKILQKIHAGVMTVDEFIKKYPILNRIGGIAVAGALLWIWLNMSFTGASLDYDIDQSAVLDALSGNYSLADLFTSPGGLKTLAFLALGMSGVSVVSYFPATAYNLTMSIVYTALKKSKFKDNSTMEKIKKKIFAIAESYPTGKMSFKQYNQFIKKSFKSLQEELNNTIKEN